MGAYTSTTLIRDNYKRFVSTTLIDDAKINFFIARVEGLINGILYKVYAIPLYSTDGSTPYIPDIIVTIATDMVTAKCLKYFYDSNQAEENPVAKNMWKENLEMLKSMVTKYPELFLPCKLREGVSIGEDGKLEFGSLTNGPSEIWSTSFDSTTKVPYKPIFNMDDWTDSKLDSNQEYDIYYDRTY
ncbi:MAG TPA: hypothetical protein PKI46_00200 [Bacteroidales bacterium]|nr:hypothetical protein [Bacteroidales bacterium]